MFIRSCRDLKIGKNVRVRDDLRINFEKDFTYQSEKFVIPVRNQIRCESSRDKRWIKEIFVGFHVN